MAQGVRVSWRIILGVGAAYSLFAALVSYWFTQATGLSLWTLRADASANFAYILAMNFVLWTGWAVFAPVIFELSRRFRFDRQGWRRALLVHLPTAIAITSLHIVAVASGRFVLQSLWGVDTAWQAGVHDAFFRTLDYELPVYWALVGLQHALDYYGEVRAREVRAAHLETRLIEAQLQALQRQLHPHFLFNTLHAISALVHRDPHKADAMIERLSDLLRVTLDKVGIQEVTLSKEIEYLQAYLDIEQVHFGDRLEICYRIDAHALDALVPYLVLQPLAENAIRHGLAPQSRRGLLTIEATRKDSQLVLRVSDNGEGMSSDLAISRSGDPAILRCGDQPIAKSPDHRSTDHQFTRSSDHQFTRSPDRQGVGLVNTRARLERLYRDAAMLTISPNVPRGTVATVIIPFTPSAEGGVQGAGESQEARFRPPDARPALSTKHTARTKHLARSTQNS